MITSNQGVAHTSDSPSNPQWVILPSALPTGSCPPASQWSLSSSSSSTDPGDVQRQLERLLAVVDDACGQCRMCWINGEVTEPHYTYRCQNTVLSSHGRKSFSIQAKDAVCFLYFALTPYSPPFNHNVPPPGGPCRGELSEYPDVIKELAYLLYNQVELRNAAFGTLGQPAPPTMNSYCL